MKISVLVPNYNNGRGCCAFDKTFSPIEECVTALLESRDKEAAQGGDGIEIIILDNASTDDGLPFLEALAAADELDLLKSDTNLGISQGRNVLMQHATGDVFVHLDGDARPMGEWWNEIRKFFDEQPQAGVIGPKQYNFKKEVHSFGDFILNGPTPSFQQNQSHDIVRVDHTMGAMYVIKREVAEDVGEYDTEIVRADSVDYSVRVNLKGHQVWTCPTLMFQHFHQARAPRSNTVADLKKNVIHDHIYFIRKYGFDWFFPKTMPGYKALYERYKDTPLLWNENWEKWAEEDHTEEFVKEI